MPDPIVKEMKSDYNDKNAWIEDQHNHPQKNLYL